MALQQGLLGLASPQQGLLSGMLNPEALRSQQLMGLAQGILQASGPSAMPVGFGQALGQGLQGAQQAQDSYQNRALREAMLGLELKKAQKVDPIKVGEGETLLDPFTRQPIFTGNKKAPSGYRYKEDGVSLEAVPGGPDDPLAPKKFTPEQAGKVSMGKNALNAVNKAREMLLDENGKADLGKLISANLNIPGTEGRQIRNLMKNAIEAQLRLESGAAVPESEVERALDRFMPSPLDSDSTKSQKMQQLQNLLGGTLTAAGVAPQQPGTDLPDPLGIR